MSASLIVWLSVAGILFLIFVIRIIAEVNVSKRGESKNRRKRTFRIIELGHADDEFFIPGDVAGKSRYDDYDQYYN